MALINKLDNTASITYNGSNILSNTVETLLLVVPLIVKTVDKLIADVGDTLVYSVDITNVGLTGITNLPFSDTLPAGCTFVSNSFTVNGSSVTPVLTGNVLTYTIPSIASLGIAKIQFQVEVTGGEA